MLPQAADATTSASRTLRVPGDLTTIGAALAAARNGDTILVSPGTYDENINFAGKVVKLVSTDGPARTIIDGGRRRSVVSMHQGETRGTHLNGFTIRNGLAEGLGGGVLVLGASPTIINNWIVDNSGCGSGIGMHASQTAALIKNNLISRNRFSRGCLGGGGIGLSVGGVIPHPIFTGGAEYPEVTGNTITDNRPVLAHSGTYGGGLSMNFGVSYRVSGNYIADNHAQNGGGVSLINDMGGALLIQNVIVRNKADDEGGGINYQGVIEPYKPALVGNTIADNTAARASGVLLHNFTQGVPLIGNIIASSAGPAVFCRPASGEGPPVFTKSDFWAAGTGPVSAKCPALSTGVGNISLAPRFVAPGSDYRLRPSSPAIDRGAPAGSLPARDFAGRPRAVDGNGDGRVVPDMGAFEYQP